MIGESDAIARVREQLERIAVTDLTVLVQGETGTGKELCAEAIHARSRRSRGPFIVVDLGAIVPTLVEAHLFGHERGAFTGAHRQQAGAFELAHGGTLFLDEIGELPLELQPKLLRAIERRQFRRVGDDEVRRVDVRIVSATNRDLAAEVQAGRFRADLFHRLRVAELRVPPLRERREDVPRLAEHFLAALGAEPGWLGAAAMARLARHDWPGNVRELRHVVERAFALGEAPDPAPRTVSDGPLSVTVDVSIPFHRAKQELVAEFERRYLSRLLAVHGGNVSRAARAARLDRMWLTRILERFGIERRRRVATSGRGA